MTHAQDPRQWRRVVLRAARAGERRRACALQRHLRQHAGLGIPEGRRCHAICACCSTIAAARARASIRPGRTAWRCTRPTCKGLLDALGIRKAHIGGISYGGEISLIFGYTYPEATKSVIACSAVSQIDPLLRGIAERWKLAAASQDGETFFKLTYTENFSEGVDCPQLGLPARLDPALPGSRLRRRVMSTRRVPGPEHHGAVAPHRRRPRSSSAARKTCSSRASTLTSSSRRYPRPSSRSFPTPGMC